MRINHRWHQILGSSNGVPLSNAVDCNAFGLETSAGLVMFDAGAGIDPVELHTAVAAAGFANGPRHLFLTHGHADHSGGAAHIARQYGSVVYAGPLTAEWLAAGDEERISLPAARRAGVYPDQYKWQPLVIDQIVDDAAAIAIGDAEIRPVATPGHSADHLSYLVTIDGEATLIAGDAIFAGGTIILQDIWDSSVAQSCESIRRLASLSFDAFLAGHGSAVLSGAKSHVAEAMQRVARLLPPRNFV